MLYVWSTCTSIDVRLRAVNVHVGCWLVRFDIDEGTVKYNVLGYSMPCLTGGNAVGGGE